MFDYKNCNCEVPSTALVRTPLVNEADGMHHFVDDCFFSKTSWVPQVERLPTSSSSQFAVTSRHVSRELDVAQVVVVQSVVLDKLQA